MKRFLIVSRIRSGYSRFMKYVHDVFDHPKREAIEQRLETIKFCDEIRVALPGLKIAFLWAPENVLVELLERSCYYLL